MISEGIRNCSDLGPAEQRNRDSKVTNKLPNINACENGRSNLSANLRVMALKMLELTLFASINLSIYFNFLRAVVSDDIKGSFLIDELAYKYSVNPGSDSV